MFKCFVLLWGVNYKIVSRCKRKCTIFKVTFYESHMRILLPNEFIVEKVKFHFEMLN